MAPTMLSNLQRCADFVADELRKGTAAAEIISRMVEVFGAKLTLRPATNTLRACSVSGTCTWSKDEGLLNAWRRNATVRIMRERSK